MTVPLSTGVPSGATSGIEEYAFLGTRTMKPGLPVELLLLALHDEKGSEIPDRCAGPERSAGRRLHDGAGAPGADRGGRRPHAHRRSCTDRSTISWTASACASPRPTARVTRAPGSPDSTSRFRTPRTACSNGWSRPASSSGETTGSSGSSRLAATRWPTPTSNSRRATGSGPSSWTARRLTRGRPR